MISILLAAYNGAGYISEQLESLLEQTTPFDTLYIQDDCSADNTWSIIEGYQKQHPDRIIISRNEKNSGNTKHNFMSLISHVRDDYIMLCDQDDVWLPQKIENALAKMREMEQKHGKNMPLLVHTDLVVVDKTLGLINPSFDNMVGTACISSLKQLILQCNVTGCTVMYNRPLAEYISREPRFLVMHDWWLALTAMCFGKTEFLDSADILYRQHGANVLGAVDIKGIRYIVRKVLNFKAIKTALAEAYCQAGALLDEYREYLTAEQVELLTIYSSLPQHRKLKRLMLMKKHGLFRKGFYRTLSQIFFG